MSEPAHGPSYASLQAERDALIAEVRALRQRIEELEAALRELHAVFMQHFGDLL